MARGSRSHGTTGVRAPLDVHWGCVCVLHVTNNSAVSLHAWVFCRRGFFVDVGFL